jgi:UDP-N-acetyl-D-glucosamine dehydrogenase
MMTLAERIKTREATVVVVGAGYVGLPLAVETAKAGFKTTVRRRRSTC